MFIGREAKGLGVSGPDIIGRQVQGSGLRFRIQGTAYLKFSLLGAGDLSSTHAPKLGIMNSYIASQN